MGLQLDIRRRNAQEKGDVNATVHVLLRAESGSAGPVHQCSKWGAVPVAKRKALLLMTLCWTLVQSRRKPLPFDEGVDWLCSERAVRLCARAQLQRKAQKAAEVQIRVFPEQWQLHCRLFYSDMVHDKSGLQSSSRPDAKTSKDVKRTDATFWFFGYVAILTCVSTELYKAVNSVVTEPYMVRMHLCHMHCHSCTPCNLAYCLRLWQDEIFHVRQTATYCDGEFAKWDGKMTTFPGLYVHTLNTVIWRLPGSPHSTFCRMTLKL